MSSRSGDHVFGAAPERGVDNGKVWKLDRSPVVPYSGSWGSRGSRGRMRWSVPESGIVHQGLKVQT